MGGGGGWAVDAGAYIGVKEIMGYIWGLYWDYRVYIGVRLGL